MADEIVQLMAQRETAAKITGRISENKFWIDGLFNQDLSQPPFVNIGTFQRRLAELKTLSKPDKE
jgi:hypothetical protein